MSRTERCTKRRTERREQLSAGRKTPGAIKRRVINAGSFFIIPVICLAFGICPSALLSQGFDWSWSPRAPRSMPTLFAGIEIGAGYSQHTSDVTYAQNFITCCQFDGGSSMPMHIAVISEKWIGAQTAIHGGAGFSYSQSSFTTPGDTLPTDDYTVLTEWDYHAGLTYGTIEVGIRQRLFKSFFSAGLTLRGQILVSSSERLVERVVSPDEYYFDGSPPTKEYEYTSLPVTAFSSFVFEPTLSFQYDISLGTGYYIAPSLNLSVPVTSISTDATWRYLWAGFGIRLLRGL